MKSLSTKEIPCKGLDERHLTERGSGSVVKNLRAANVGWKNDRGWEPFRVAIATQQQFNKNKLNPVDNLHIWTRHNGSEVYYIQQQDGKLFYEIGNNNGVLDADRVDLVDGLVVPKPNEPLSQFVGFNKFLLCLDSNSRSYKFYGGERIEEFGFTSAPQAPVPMGVTPLYGLKVDIGDDYEPLMAGTTCLHFQSNRGTRNVDDPWIWGLGTDGNNDNNYYNYKVSFIKDTGAESPLSDAGTVAWETRRHHDGTIYTYGITVSDIPTGGADIIKRKIYRTKNLGDFPTTEGLYYHVATIDENVSTSWTDCLPDSSLVVPAPAASASIIYPQTFAMGCAWDGRLWLAKNQKLIYSQAGKPEQFGANDYFDVGGREGGIITGVIPYYNNLLVFRERGIDVIRNSRSTGSYTIASVSSAIGTTATNGIVVAPKAGCLFLSKDGIYRLSGGLDGGSAISIEPLTDKSNKTIKRLSLTALPRTTAAYSHKEKEVWFHFPVDGNTYPSLGLVYHTETGQISTRETVDDAMNWNKIVANPNGWFIIAPNTYETTGDSDLEDQIWRNVGLQVWSACGTKGNVLDDGTIYLQGDIRKFDTAAGDDLRSTWTSVWEDFGDNSKKQRIISVEVQLLTQGNNQLTLDYSTNRKSTFDDGGTNKQQIVDEEEDTIYLLGGDGNTTVIGTDAYTEEKRTRVRWDVSTGLISEFRFRIQDQSTFQVLSYQLEFLGGERKVVNALG